MLTCQRGCHKLRLSSLGFYPAEASSDALNDWLALATPTFRLDPGGHQGGTETFSGGVSGLHVRYDETEGGESHAPFLCIHHRCVYRCAWSPRGSTTMLSSRKWERKRQPSPSSSKSWERSNPTLQQLLAPQDRKDGSEEQPSMSVGKAWKQGGGACCRVA